MTTGGFWGGGKIFYIWIVVVLYIYVYIHIKIHRPINQKRPILCILILKIKFKLKIAYIWSSGSHLARAKTGYTLNTLMPMVGLENGSGNEDQREQINKPRESLMITGYEIKSWMAGWKGRKERKKYTREYIGEWWRTAQMCPSRAT